MNIKLVIQYNGTRYQGWQRLGKEQAAVSIQGLLEQELGAILNENVMLTGSGRTDAGVHAYGQVANFKTRQTVDVTSLKVEVNKRLPKDIQVVSAEEVPAEFHSRYSAVSKQYEYHITTGDHEDVFARETSLFVKGSLDLKAMRRGAALLEGTHDFAGFASKMPDGRGTVKTLSKVEIASCGNAVVITYEGDGFLYNMVRIMTGTLLEIGKGERTPESISEVFKTKNRQKAGKTVEGKGLFLMKVVYLLQKN